MTKPEESRRSRWSDRRVHEVEAKPEVQAEDSESDENPHEVPIVNRKISETRPRRSDERRRSGRTRIPKSSGLF